MRVGNGEDFIYSAIVWTPILVVLMLIVLFFTHWLGQFEAITQGSEVMIPNSASVDPMSRPQTDMTFVG